MAFSPAGWARSNVRVYYKNAAAVRDYRVQLRGNKAVILWAVYLAVLIGFGMLTYNSAASQERMSVVAAQASLQRFYSSILGLLSTLVAMIAPALTATAIVTERQRRSLDLVFSAPVSPKYYLVGKLLSSYRYVWMLLVLSLPITSACVVLGGATWSEVIVSYVLMSIQGLIYTSIALFFSTTAQKPVGAIVWSYLTVFCVYWPLAMSLGGMDALPMMIGRQSVNEMSFLVCMMPFSIPHAATSYTVLFGFHCPNWILAALFALAFAKIMLLAAASVLSPFGSAETKSLRVHGLIYAFLLSLGLTASLTNSIFAARGMAGMSGPGASSAEVELMLCRSFVGLLLCLCPFLPFLSCYGVELEKKFWPDGAFRIRRIFLGTPSGGLPYLLALGLSIAAGVAAIVFWFPGNLGTIFGAYVFYGIAMLFACWSAGRFTSALNNGLRYARTLHFTSLILVFALPLPFLFVASPSGFSDSGLSIWDFYVLRPFFSSGDRSWLAAVLGTVFLIVGLVVAKASETIAKGRYKRAGLKYD